MIYKLNSRESVREATECLAKYLQEKYVDHRGSVWTDAIFATLRDFCREHLEITQQECFHRRHPDGQDEFVWDFLAVTKNRGAVLVAESEQHTNGKNLGTDLNHDFEKLLYVFAPIRVLICKCRSEKHRNDIIKSLTDYSNGSCQQFNPGSVFLLHFGMWEDAEAKPNVSHTYIWQSRGEYKVFKPEALEFTKVSITNAL